MTRVARIGSVREQRQQVRAAFQMRHQRRDEDQLLALRRRRLDDGAQRQKTSGKKPFKSCFDTSVIVIVGANRLE